MAVSKAYKISQDVVTLFSMLLFTAIRLADQRLRRAPVGRMAASEKFASTCLIIATALVIAECGLAERRNILLWRAHPKNAKEALAFEFRSSTIKLNFWENYIHSLSVWLLKATYLATFWRITRVMARLNLYFLYAVSGLAVSGFITTALINLLLCRPIDINWHPVYSPQGELLTCSIMASIPAISVYTALNVTTDLLVAIQSLLIVRTISLQSNVERGALILIVLIGILSIIAPIARLVVFHWLFTDPKNVTADNFHVMELLTRIEIVFGTAAYTLVVSRTLLRKLAAKFSKVSGSIRETITRRGRKPPDPHSLALYSFAEPTTQKIPETTETFSLIIPDTEQGRQAPRV